MKIKSNAISEKLETYKIEELSYEYEFLKNRNPKLSAEQYIHSFFETLNQGEHNIGLWAEQGSFLIGESYSPSGIVLPITIGICGFRQMEFATEFLKTVIKQESQKCLEEQLKRRLAGLESELLRVFNNVYVEDSTCINVPKCLANVFPGAYSKSGANATVRIQLRQELKSELNSDIQIQSFRDNDQKHSSKIVDDLESGDMVVRDLGYFSTSVFRQIIEKGAYFLSRLRSNVNIYEENGELLDFDELLRKKKRRNINTIDINVRLKSKEQLPVRLVAIRVPEKIANERRRKAKKDRSKSANHSKSYYERLDWVIFITNVPKEIWKPKNLFTVYSYRWRIEIIFKSWKSGLKINKIFEAKKSMTEPMAWIVLHLILAWIILFFTRWFNFFLIKVFETTGRFVSIMKFSGFFRRNFDQLLQSDDLELFIDHVAYYHTYSKHNNRQHFYENLYMLN